MCFELGRTMKSTLFPKGKSHTYLMTYTRVRKEPCPRSVRPQRRMLVWEFGADFLVWFSLDA